MAEPPPGAALLHRMARCDALQGEGRGQDRAQGPLQYTWHQQGGVQGGPGHVHIRERRGQFLAVGAHRPEQPRTGGHPYRLYGQPQGLYRGHNGHFPQGPGAEVHRAPDTQFPAVCRLEGPKGVPSRP